MLFIGCLVLALALTQAALVSCEEKGSDFTDAAKEKFQKGLDLAKEGFAKAEDAISRAKEKLGPLASNFTQDVKDKFNEGVQKAQEVLTQVKETVSSHVSPFVNKVRKGMLDGVRNLRDKLNNKNETTKKGEGDTQKDPSEFGEKAGEKVEINSGSKKE